MSLRALSLVWIFEFNLTKRKVLKSSYVWCKTSSITYMNLVHVVEQADRIFSSKIFLAKYEMGVSMTKQTKWLVSPVKTQFNMCIRTVWSKSSLCAQWVAKEPGLLHADSEDSVRLGRCPGWSESSLGAQFILLLLSCGSSNSIFQKRAKLGLNAREELLGEEGNDSEDQVILTMLWIATSC